MKQENTTMGAFTLIEVLLVIALIAILAAITFIAINPAKNFADARDTQRQSDVTQILNSITQFTLEPGNSLGDLGTIPTCPTTAIIGTSDVDLTANLVPEFIVAIPEDPTTGSTVDTGYTICQTTNARITISGTPENAAAISVRR